MSVRTPSYRLHKPTHQAVVTLNGRDIYLGRHGSPESRAEYDRRIAEWLLNGRCLVGSDVQTDLTVSEVMVRYISHADAYYTKGGLPTSEVGLIRLSLRVLRSLYGHTPAKAFGPLALKTVRQSYIDSGLCRNEVNRRTGHVVRFFRWAVENELVPASVHHGLKAVAGLRKGRTDVRESKPVKPVDDALVDAIQPYVSPQVWAMIQLQRLTGMRPGEVAAMRTGDIDRSGAVWIYTPREHKTEHHDRDRVIGIGPRGQGWLRDWLRADPDTYLFSPREFAAAKAVERRERRKTPMTPSQLARGKKARPKRAPSDHYTPTSYRRAIARACEQAGVAQWHPNRLRHNAATRLRREFGLDVARVILGHSSPAVTEVYAEVDREKALDIMGRVG
jgi:integrase